MQVLRHAVIRVCSGIRSLQKVFACFRIPELLCLFLQLLLLLQNIPYFRANLWPSLPCPQSTQARGSSRGGRVLFCARRRLYTRVNGASEANVDVAPPCWDPMRVRGGRNEEISKQAPYLCNLTYAPRLRSLALSWLRNSLYILT